MVLLKPPKMCSCITCVNVNRLRHIKLLLEMHGLVFTYLVTYLSVPNMWEKSNFICIEELILFINYNKIKHKQCA